MFRGCIILQLELFLMFAGGISNSLFTFKQKEFELELILVHLLRTVRLMPYNPLVHAQMTV